MEITVQIPEAIWARLQSEAAETGQKNFSTIITDAVQGYLQRKDRANDSARRQMRRQIAGKLYGSIAAAEGDDELKLLYQRRHGVKSAH